MSLLVTVALPGSNYNAFPPELKITTFQMVLLRSLNGAGEYM